MGAPFGGKGPPAWTRAAHAKTDSATNDAAALERNADKDFRVHRVALDIIAIVAVQGTLVHRATSHDRPRSRRHDVEAEASADVVEIPEVVHERVAVKGADIRLDGRHHMQDILQPRAQSVDGGGAAEPDFPVESGFETVDEEVAEACAEDEIV